MNKPSYLKVTYRNGRPLAAYYYLPRRDGDKSVRTERADGGVERLEWADAAGMVFVAAAHG